MEGSLKTIRKKRSCGLPFLTASFKALWVHFAPVHFLPKMVLHFAQNLGRAVRELCLENKDILRPYF